MNLAQNEAWTNIIMRGFLEADDSPRMWAPFYLVGSKFIG